MFHPNEDNSQISYNVILGEYRIWFANEIHALYNLPQICGLRINIFRVQC